MLTKNLSQPPYLCFNYSSLNNLPRPPEDMVVQALLYAPPAAYPTVFGWGGAFGIRNLWTTAIKHVLFSSL